MLPRPNPKEIDRKQRMGLPSAGVPKQSAEARRTNFGETYLRLDPDQVHQEAARCIQCPGAPCIKACPLHNDIPYAMWHLEHGQFEEAASVFRQTSSMPEICGRVCPQVLLCEGACIYNKKNKPPVPVGRLEAFAADYEREHGGRLLERAPATGHRVAVVGAGPAGITVADLLARRGHAVTVFDTWPAAGGILRYGIPRFKMDHGVVDDIVDYLTALGVTFRFGVTVGRDVTFDALRREGYEAFFLGVGAGVGADCTVAGSDLHGVYDATPFLVQANVAEQHKPASLAGRPAIGATVAVIGGGDTAMDCVRTAVRLGASRVMCVYRRTEGEMPGNERDRALARDEGVEFHWLTQPLRFVDDGTGHVCGMECVRMELGEPDASGRPRPVPVDGSEFVMDVETVISALGYWPDPLMGEAEPSLVTHDWGLIGVDDDTGRTSVPDVFAGGDDVLGPNLVVNAVAQGRRAAAAIDRYLLGGAGSQT